MVAFDKKRIELRMNNFREMGIWPVQEDFDVEGWLDNFLPDQKDTAYRLLSGFTYFDEKMTKALFGSAINECYSDISEYDIELDDIFFVICEGEHPNPTDSGHLFARMLRKKFSIPEKLIVTSKEALKGANNKKIFIFIDDFIGSGSQFIETLNRSYADLNNESFRNLLDQDKHIVCYCSCVSTEYGRKEIKSKFNNVDLYSAHILNDRDTVFSEKSRFWNGLTAEDKNKELEKIKNISNKLGYNTLDEGLNDWRGFHKLGLAIAFNHGIPDACLPIFFSSRNGWKPLIERPDD